MKPGNSTGYVNVNVCLGLFVKMCIQAVVRHVFVATSLQFQEVNLLS